MSWLSRFKEKRVRLAASKAYEWQDQELGIYFAEQLDDPFWKTITPRMAELIQQGFSEIYRRTELEKYHDTNELPSELIDVISEVANKFGGPNVLSPAFVVLVTHQYVDADKLMRQVYRTRWIAFMVKRSTFAPPPESYFNFIKAQYFGSSS